MRRPDLVNLPIRPPPFLVLFSRQMDRITENARGRELIDALDEERRKVEAFRRELPLCLQLIDQTIESCKKTMVGEDEMELSLRPAGSSVERDPPPVAPEKPTAIRATKNWGEALDLEKEEEGGINNDGACCDGEGREHGNESSHGEEIKKGRRRRKARRFWSEEMHKRFTHALEQLGGCEAATPKHIRKLMKVDGLTNDEVKSHLQKYRLHARRSAGGRGFDGNTSSPQFVVAVRGIWIPTPDCTPVMTSADAATAPATGIGIQAEAGRHHRAPRILPLLPSPLIFLNQDCQQQQHKAN